MLRRHWAIIKALLVVMIVGIVIFGIVFYILIQAGKTFGSYESGSIVALPMMAISYYIARLSIKAILPVKY